jgi:TRAP-type C4-dicarboxylate transport system permease small subunit
MQFLDRAAERLAQTLALLGAVGVVALLVHVLADVAARNIAGRPIPATNEIASRYYMVLIAFLPLAWVERRRAMISVELIDSLLPAPVRRLSDRLVAALAVAIYAALAWVTWVEASRAFAAGSFVDVLGRRLPVWPSYLLPPLGFSLATLVTLLRAVRG